MRNLKLQILTVFAFRSFFGNSLAPRNSQLKDYSINQTSIRFLQRFALRISFEPLYQKVNRCISIIRTESLIQNKTLFILIVSLFLENSQNSHFLSIKYNLLLSSSTVVGTH